MKKIVAWKYIGKTGLYYFALYTSISLLTGYGPAKAGGGVG